MTRTQRVLAKLNLLTCNCDLCTIERVTVDIEKQVNKLKKRVVFRNKKIMNVGWVSREYVQNFKNLSRYASLDMDEIMGELALRYLKLCSVWTSQPHTDVCEIFDSSETVLEALVMHLLSKNYRYLKPKCYQIHLMIAFRVDKIYGRDIFSREQLVGIEPNPGPDFMLMQYLKNMDRIDECASTRKRHRSVAKSLVAAERKNAKSKEKALNYQRMMKNCRILPQGLFDTSVGLDSTTKDFLENILDRFLRDFKGVEVKHTVEIPFTDKVSYFFSLMKKAGEKVWNICVALFRVFLTFVSPFIADLIGPFLEPKEKFVDCIEPQGGLSWSTLMTVIHAKHLASIVRGGDWMLFTEVLGDIKKKAIASTSGQTMLMGVVNEIANFVYEITGFKIPFMYKEDLLIKEINEEAKLLWDQYSQGNIQDYEFAERVAVFANEVENLLYEKRQTVTPEQKEKLQYLLRKFQPLMQYCMRFVNPNNGPRTEPLAILIGGPTGVGKSTITVPFLLSLMSRILPEDKKEQFMRNHNDFMFFRANENEFWDGYKMRNVAVVYDDFGQMKDSVGAPSADAFEMIRLKNTAPYHLHFAALEDKQRNFATPKLIFATSNLHKLHFNGITCSEAVARRFDLAYVQVPKLEFSRDSTDCNLWSRRLDVEKVRAQYPMDPSDPSTYVALDVIEYIPWDFIKGERADGPVLGFWELLDKAERKYQQVSLGGDRMLAFHKFMKENPRVQTEAGFEDFAQVFDKTKSAMSSIASGAMSYSGQYLGDLRSNQFFTGIGLALGVAYGLYAYTRSDSSAAPDLQSSSSKLEVKKNEKKGVPVRSRAREIRALNRAVPKSTNMLSAQSGDSSLNPYLKVLKRNMYRIATSERPESDLGYVIFLFERVFVLPRHFVYMLDSASEACDGSTEIQVCFKNPITGNIAFRFEWSQTELYDYHEPVEGVPPPDTVYLRIPDAKCRVHADISDMFLNYNELKKDERVSAQMVIERNKQLLFLLPKVRFDTATCKYGSGVVDEQGEDMNLYADLSYEAPSEKGDCGAPLITIDPRFGRPRILGIHTAGMTSTKTGKTKLAFGTTVNRAEIEHMKKYLPNPLKKEEIEVEDVNIEGFSALHAAPQPRVPDTTKIIKSEMADDLWETTTVPAHLKNFTNSKGERKEPRKIARMGYSHSEVYLYSETLDRTHALVTNLVLKAVEQPIWEPKVFDFETAVKGIDGVDFVDSVNRSTSPGYPYVLENRQKGKTAWFGSGEEILLDTHKAKEVKQKVLEIIEKAKDGVRCEHIYVDYLKDERRPIAKVDVGKTRQFMACGMDLLIAMKMYFGDFIRHVCANRIQNGIAIGINPYTEWGTLVKYMGQGPLKVHTAGDYSKYDAKIPVEIAYKVLDVVEKYYYNSTVEDKQIRSILFLEIVNSLHLSEGIVYEFCGGNPSGQPMTSVFNSIANLEILAYVGAANASKHMSFAEFKTVFERTRFQVFGDDNIIAYEPRDEKVFGQKILEETMPKFVGMDYTNEMKDGKEVSQRRIQEISFLKRGFRFDHGVWQCPLELGVIHETLSWKRDTSTEAEMKLRVESVLSELARHGKEVFERDSPRVISSCTKNFNYVPENSNYHIAINSEDGLAYM